MAETQNTGQFAKTIVTDVGKDMIAKSQNGQTLTFSRVALGDGLVGEEEDVTKFTAVKNERLSLPIAKYSNLGNGQFQIQFRLTNSQVESGFWHREIGIMAKIDNGQEQLYAYTTAGNKASFIYDKTTPVEERIVNVNFVIGNAQNLKVIINSSVIYATIEDLEEALDAHDAGADAHEPAFDAHNAADDAHKDFTGATAEAAGKRGMVPAPGKNQQNALLGGDGLWHGIATIEEINAGINDNKIISAKALKNARPLKTYTDWAQLDLDENTNTFTDLVSALPNGSMFINFIMNQNYQEIELPARGFLLISKENGNILALLRAHYTNNGHLWFYTPENGGTWKCLATSDVMPVGTILPFAGGSIPSGFLACNGAAVSRTTYSNLFSAIGTTYGSGDGSTTFNLPAVEDNRFLEFSSTRGTKKNAGLPNITGGPTSTGIGGTANRDDVWVGALATRIVDERQHSRDGSTNPYYGLTQTSLDASKSSSIYGGSTTVQPKSLTVRAIIKY